MIVHLGGVPSGFHNRKPTANDATTNLNAKGVGLYHIHGTTQLNTRAIQVKEVASSLNSGDVFALLTPDNAYIWNGKGATAEEKQVALVVSKLFSGKRTVVQVDEGSEPGFFWTAIGGKKEYASTRLTDQGSYEPRLFDCSTLMGALKVSEIPNYVQEDLINDDVMILDNYSEVFVWVGYHASKQEKDQSINCALQYVKNAPDGRSPDTPIYKINAGHEPPNFTCHFFGWDDNKANDFEDPYLKGLKKVGGGEPSPASEQKMEKVTSVEGSMLNPDTYKCSLADLQNNRVPQIQSDIKEMYLEDSEFEKLFKMKKQEFKDLPKWKKDQLKKQNNLF